MKKTWETPRLIVLVRSEPAEVVLSLCKGTASAGDPNNEFTNCYHVGAANVLILCTGCQDVEPS